MSKFEVGDMVIDPIRFEGELKVELSIMETYPIRVTKDGKKFLYTRDGKYDVQELLPSLHHAGTKITIEEAAPARWPWVNIYKQKTETNVLAGISISNLFETKDKAVASIGEVSIESCYVFTIQIKPPEEEWKTEEQE